MPQWQVRDVMTTDVITVPDDASVAEIVAVLTDRQITAVPIVDSFDVILGVVSWTDLRRKIDIDTPEGDLRTGWWHRWASPRARWPEGTAVEVMSGPALTIEADAPLPAAARVMYRRGVGRLLVVDPDNRLRGIVTRSDLLKVHARLDAVIRDEVIHQVLQPTLMIPPGAVQATVDDGVVTLAGNTTHKTIAAAAVRVTEAVPGVTGVVDRLTFDLDDHRGRPRTSGGRARPAPRLVDRAPSRLAGPAGGRRPDRPLRQAHRDEIGRTAMTGSRQGRHHRR